MTTHNRLAAITSEAVHKNILTIPSASATCKGLLSEKTTGRVKLGVARSTTDPSVCSTRVHPACASLFCYIPSNASAHLCYLHCSSSALTVTGPYCLSEILHDMMALSHFRLLVILSLGSGVRGAAKDFFSPRFRLPRYVW